MARRGGGGGLPLPSDDWETGLAKLWGKETLRLVTEYVARGDIEDTIYRKWLPRRGRLKYFNLYLSFNGYLLTHILTSLLR